MRTQFGYIEKAKTLSADSGELRYDLPADDQLDSLYVEFGASCVAAASIDHDYGIEDMLTSIRIESAGKELLHNTTPEVASYLSWVKSGQIPNHRLGTRGATRLRIPIYFGRYPFDPEFGLDTTVHPKCQVVLPYSINTAYFTTGTGYLTLGYTRAMKKRPLRGILAERVYETYAGSATAEEHVVKLAGAKPLSLVGFRCWDSDNFIRNNITNVELSFGDGRLSLLNLAFKELFALNRDWYGYPIAGPINYGMMQSGDKPRTYMAECWDYTMVDHSASPAIFSNQGITDTYADLKMITDAGVAIATRETTSLRAWGGLPFQCVTVGHFMDDPVLQSEYGEPQVAYTRGAYAITLETFIVEMIGQ